MMRAEALLARIWASETDQGIMENRILQKGAE